MNGVVVPSAAVLLMVTEPALITATTGSEAMLTSMTTMIA
jgi:hypothetical protein